MPTARRGSVQPQPKKTLKTALKRVVFIHLLDDFASLWRNLTPKSRILAYPRF